MWKRCQRGGLLGRVVRDKYAGHRRFIEELIGSQNARREQLPVTEILAIASIPDGRGLTRVEMLVRFEEDCRELAEVLADRGIDGRTRGEILRNTGEVLRRFHGCGFLHGDLNLKNILLRLTPDSCYQVLLTDLDPGGLPPRASSQQNLLRLVRSYRKLTREGLPAVSSVEAFRFLHAYFGCDRVRLREMWDRSIALLVRRAR